jgi:hypothetical protein
VGDPNDGTSASAHALNQPAPRYDAHRLADQD